MSPGVTYSASISRRAGRSAKATIDRKSTRLNSSHSGESRMPSSACKKKGCVVGEEEICAGIIFAMAVGYNIVRPTRLVPSGGAFKQQYNILIFFFQRDGNDRDLHVLTHSFPTRRSSD